VLRSIRDERVVNACRPLVIGHPEVLRRTFSQGRTVGEFASSVFPGWPTDRSELVSFLDSLSDSEIAVLNPLAGDAVLAASVGSVNAAAGDAAFRFLKGAAELALDGVVDALATAPISKAALHAAGHRYPGHTEILAELCHSDDFAMMLHLPESRLRPLRSVISAETVACANGCGLSIAHATLHISLASVPGRLTTQSIAAATFLMRDFLQRLGSDRNAIAVAALNPHGGEDGLFGKEESDIIVPAVEAARDQGCHVTGPLPVDTLMRRAVAGEFDGVIAMYHDQGHIPVKLIGFDAAVNITLGLPIVRTSPTHGTAFDRARNPAAPVDASGMIEAILMAAELCSETAGSRSSEGTGP